MDERKEIEDLIAEFDKPLSNHIDCMFDEGYKKGKADTLHLIPKWISVKCKMPEERNDYLVFVQRKYSDGVPFNFPDIDYYNGVEFVEHRYHVTFWMRLPDYPTNVIT